jgi:NAD/NADP transhydrogenase beta subunit
MAYGKSVIIVPGYGMAVAQAQTPVRELMDLLLARGVDVQFAIHPVAGRMPGHMNVLLAEANVPYERLKEMDEINDDFAKADVALVIGANDVTNPAARTDTTSPIYGMPILNVDHAQNVIVLKRSMAAGFAGIDNPLAVPGRHARRCQEERRPRQRSKGSVVIIAANHGITRAPMTQAPLTLSLNTMVVLAQTPPTCAE